MSRSPKRRPRPRTDRWWWVKVVISMATATLALSAGGVAPAGAGEAVDPVGFYVMTDSNEPGGPDYAPIEAGHDLFQSDESEATVTLPFPFTFYGTTYTTVSIGANGAIELPSGEDVAPLNQDLGVADNVMIAPWWDNWRPGAGAQGRVRHDTVGVAPHRTFVVWWTGVPNIGTIGTADFQAQLFEGSDRVEFHYLDVDHLQSGNRGLSGTIGIDAGTSSALQYGHEQEVLDDGLAIRFTPARCAGRPVTHLGDEGDDVITTGPGDDVVLALGGNDHVSTGQGDDVVCAGPGADQVRLGRGADRVDLGAGNDIGHGQLGRDRLSGNPGDDRLDGGGDRDTCFGGPGSDEAPRCEARSGTP